MKGADLMKTGRFLCGVAAVILHPESDRYLLLQRAQTKDYGAGDWECVTGRVDQGEGFEEAVAREVREEIGVAATVEYIIGTTHFYRGAPTPENELLGVIYLCTVDDPDAIQTSDEHSAARWLTVDEIEALLPAGYWLRPTIHAAEMLRHQLPEALRTWSREWLRA